MSDHLFVYGTLRRGDVRWRFLEPFVVDDGEPDTATGLLFDTGAGYPAARFVAGADSIVGHRYELLPTRATQALVELDEIEGTVAGLYHRIRIVTGAGFECWAYQYGSGLALTRIVGGDWFAHIGHTPN